MCQGFSQVFSQVLPPNSLQVSTGSIPTEADTQGLQSQQRHQWPLLGEGHISPETRNTHGTCETRTDIQWCPKAAGWFHRCQPQAMVRDLRSAPDLPIWSVWDFSTWPHWGNFTCSICYMELTLVSIPGIVGGFNEIAWETLGRGRGCDLRLWPRYSAPCATQGTGDVSFHLHSGPRLAPFYRWW